MILYDLFGGEGGAGEGYARAGFTVHGFDVIEQPRYPHAFLQANALNVLDAIAEGWMRRPDVIHASPPCQQFSPLRHRTGNAYPDLIEPVRARLRALGIPYVIENVPGAPLINPIMLCGSTFDLSCECDDGERRWLRRHRLFESSVPMIAPACEHGRGPVIGVYGTGGGGKMTRGYKGNLRESRDVMGMPWASRAGVSQAIPPAYTEWVGHQLIAFLERQR